MGFGISIYYRGESDRIHVPEIPRAAKREPQQCDTSDDGLEQFVEFCYLCIRHLSLHLLDYNDLFPEGVSIDKSTFEEIQIEVQNLIKVRTPSCSAATRPLTCARLQSIEQDGKDAFSIDQGFATLASNIREFGITIERAVTAHDKRVRTKLEETRKRVDGLSLKLSEYAFVRSLLRLADTDCSVSAQGEVGGKELNAPSSTVLTSALPKMRNAGLACVACLCAGAISAAFLFFTLSPGSAHVFVVSSIRSFMMICPIEVVS